MRSYRTVCENFSPHPYQNTELSEKRGRTWSPNALSRDIRLPDKDHFFLPISLIHIPIHVERSSISQRFQKIAQPADRLSHAGNRDKLYTLLSRFALDLSTDLRAILCRIKYLIARLQAGESCNVWIFSFRAFFVFCRSRVETDRRNIAIDTLL